MTYVEILKDRIKRGEISADDAIAWLALNGNIRFCTASRLIGVRQ